MFSHLAVSGTVSEHKFAGSYSLGGWESLRQPATWPAQSGPTFPAHTADNGQRAPSLLHLSLRRGEETSKDLLFTDAPGEWYSRWVGKRSASDAKGARWIVEHSHRFILVADCAALGGPDVGIAREKLLSLARPLSEARSSREILVVWTKSDAQRSKETESVVAERLKGLFGPHDSLETNVHSVDCLAVLGWCLRPLVAQSLGPPDRKTSSAFWAYARGRE